MNDSYIKYLRVAGYALLSIAIAILLSYAGFWIARRMYSNQVAVLSTQLSQTTETLELTHGLYSKKVVEFEDLTVLLRGKTDEMKALRKQLEDSQAKLLVAEQISIRWKKAYEEVVAAHQSEEPPKDPGGPTRKRVEFSGDLGPIHASGHTLTDPPEAHLKLEQLVPLVLTMTMVQNKDESWSTYVTSSDPNMDVKIDLAGVNPLILKEKWYRRFWLDLGATITGDPGARIGLRYQFDRFSIGADCTALQIGHGCGVNVGYRIFR